MDSNINSVKLNTSPSTYQVDIHMLEELEYDASVCISTAVLADKPVPVSEQESIKPEDLLSGEVWESQDLVISGKYKGLVPVLSEDGSIESFFKLQCSNGKEFFSPVAALSQVLVQ